MIEPDPNCKKCWGRGEYIFIFDRPGSVPGNRRVECECVATDLEKFMEAMAGRWGVIQHKTDPDGRLRIVYMSLVNGITYSTRPYQPETAAPVGTEGVIGFVWKSD